ncbi:MAG: 4-(cytidine 5'-diphospho)-2-C-methyl-D-erythritol kinase [Bacteroidales bacterium]
MILYAQAKINIGLQILRKREDGFHDISTVMYAIPLRDIIELKLVNRKSAGFTMDQTGIVVPGEIESNLCYKSWQIFCKTHNAVPVKIHLHKSIPPGAGLGGGSSNATAILKGLNELTGNPLQNRQIIRLAAELGSDCSFFIKNEPVIVEGRGEILRSFPAKLNGLYMLLLHPGIGVNTAWAYQHASPDDQRDDLRTILSAPVENWRDTLVNDFESTVFLSYPEIAQLKTALYRSGAVYASMSGSGSAVYGLFHEPPVILPEIKKHLLWKGRL